jgi:hypothetical protein
VKEERYVYYCSWLVIINTLTVMDAVIKKNVFNNSDRVIFNLFENLNSALDKNQSNYKFKKNSFIIKSKEKRSKDKLKASSKFMDRRVLLYNKLNKIENFAGIKYAIKYLEGYLEEHNITMDQMLDFK